MSQRFCISLTSAKNDTDKATVAFVVANAAAASEKETLVFLSTEAVHLCQKGYTDGIHEEGFAPLGELMANFVKAGGKIWVCSPCFKKRGLDEGKLIPGATIVGGASLVEFLSEGAPSLSY
ncbi:MAG: DsrE family protein [Planctomycetes bacterium]|nr:DsrE family protein [Planctomycetota bacterium]HPF14618.1 DsrE family protein [Planctomycetota bacterium]HRV82467.1 DsrE family protein [Planctomycetota bacterium]